MVSRYWTRSLLVAALAVSFSPGAPALQTAQATAPASVIYVDKDAPGPTYDGTSWTNAFLRLQDALAVAGAGSEVWVAEGVYTPTDNPADRAATFRMNNYVKVYGGFSGVETLREERDFAAHPTILSGDIDGNDSQSPVITDITTVTGNTTNSFIVVRSESAWGMILGWVLDGFTITGGYANGAGSSGWIYSIGGGGGVQFVSPLAGPWYAQGEAPLLANCAISGNAGGWSGGIYSWGTAPALDNVTLTSNTGSRGGGFYLSAPYPQAVLNNVTFTRNIATNIGGGMAISYMQSDGYGNYIDFPPPLLRHVTFTDNSAPVYGGGLSVEWTKADLDDVTFSGNSAQYGGGLAVWEDSVVNVKNSIFSGNKAIQPAWNMTGEGGGIFIDTSLVRLDNIKVLGNYIPGGLDVNGLKFGGGIATARWSTVTLNNSLVSGNQAIEGAGVYNDSSDLTITNCTISGNQGLPWVDWGIVICGGVSNEYGSVKIYNSVIANNPAYYYGAGNVLTYDYLDQVVNGNKGTAGTSGPFEVVDSILQNAPTGCRPTRSISTPTTTWQSRSRSTWTSPRASPVSRSTRARTSRCRSSRQRSSSPPRRTHPTTGTP